VDGKRDVLPEDIGRTAQGEGRRLNVTQLTKLGREAACEANHCKPTSNSAIKFGLNEAAKLDPLEAEIEKVPALVKAALFDAESLGNTPSAELIEIVQRRFWVAVRAHQSDSTDSFYKWSWDRTTRWSSRSPSRRARKAEGSTAKMCGRFCSIWVCRPTSISARASTR